MSQRTTELVERLKSEASKTLDFFRGIKVNEWQINLYAEPEQWTVLQVLAHLAASEKGFKQLMENILAGGSGSPEDFDLDGYNQRKVNESADKNPQDLLQMFAKRRQAMIDFVQSIPDEKLSLRGRHPFIGEASLEDMIKLLYLHNRLHLRDIRKNLETATD